MLKRNFVFNFIFAFFFAVTTTVFANISLMPLADIKPGMKGIGKTVVKGDKIENFNVEILGINGSQALGETIFVRLYGDLIDRVGGVAQGMSGSPVYVDGRLVGAVAFGQTFNDPHYCFLTPIGRMLDLVDEISYPSNWLPKGTALSAGGFTEDGYVHLKERLAKYNLETIPGGSGNVAVGEFKPGSSIGVSLVNGDVTLGALGTVTWTDDDGNILAFGHQFLKRGAANFFLNKVWILGTVPNLQSAYKVGQIGQVAGTISQDRMSGVAGTIGSEPKSIPLTVNIGDFNRGNFQTVSVKLVDDELLFSELVDSVVYNTLTKVVDRVGGGTAQLKFSLDATGGQGDKKERYEIRRENMYFATANLLKNLDGEMISTLANLSLNKYNALNIEKIVVDIKVTDDLRVAELKEVSIPKADYHVGDVIPVKVKMKPYRGDEFDRIVNFTIPKDYKGKKITICVRGGSSLLWLERLLKKNQEEQMPLQSKESKQVLKDYVEQLNTRDKNNELVIDVGGKELSVIAKKNEAGLVGLLKGTPAKIKQEYDFIVMGEIEVSFDVKK